MYERVQSMKEIPFNYTTITTHGDRFTQWECRLSNGTLYVFEQENDDLVLYEVNYHQYCEVPGISAQDWLTEHCYILEKPCAKLSSE